MKLRPFELALVVVFIVLIVLSLIFLSSYKKAPEEDALVIGEVTIWGVLPEDGIEPLLFELRDIDDAYLGVSYEYISPETFSEKLTNALADGEGPDMLLMSHEQLVELRKRIQPLSYESFPLRDIKDRYIDGALVFALTDGLYAYPVAVDPLVMYWNKDILTTKGFLAAPVTWDELLNKHFPALIDRNADRTINRSVVALGEYPNVRNAFGIISTLLLQSGTKGVVDAGDNSYQILLNESYDTRLKPVEALANSYPNFSRPSSPLYTWNRSFNEDRDRFLSGDLVFYFGYGSEGSDLEQLNPNLSFDISEVPQDASATVRRTYGKFYGLAALKSSDNLAGVAIVMQSLGSSQTADSLAQKNRLVPTTRSSVATGSNDTYGRIAYKSATVAYGWLSPRQPAVAEIFTAMTRDINENRSDIMGASYDVLGKLQLEYK